MDLQEPTESPEVEPLEETSPPIKPVSRVREAMYVMLGVALLLSLLFVVATVLYPDTSAPYLTR